MKILFAHYAVIDREGFGRTFMLAREMSARGHQVTLLTDQPKGSFRFPWKKEMREGVRIYAFPDITPSSFRRTGFGFLSLILKSWFAATQRFDIVHGDNGHRPSSGLPCRINRLIHGSRYVTEWWDHFGKGGQYDELQGFKKFTKGSYDLFTEVRDKRSADFVVTLSEAMKSRALLSGIASSKMQVIHGGADIRSIRPHDCEASRRKFGLPQGKLIFGFIGMNEGEFNDVAPFAEAMANLKGKLPLHWFTTGRKLSLQIRQKYNLEACITEFGWIDYAGYSELLSCADVFVLTQRPNACNAMRWPNKFGDYLAAGRVVLTTPVGDVTQLCTRYSRSVVCCDFTPEAITETIRRLYEESATLGERGFENRRIAEKEFSWEIQSLKLEEVYRGLVGKRE